MYDTSVISEVPELDSDVRVVGVPFAKIAHEMGNVRVKNIMALGALQAATGFMESKSLLTALDQALQSKPELLEINHEAFARGVQEVEIVA